MLVKILEGPLPPTFNETRERSRKKPKLYNNFKMLKAGQESMSAPTKVVEEETELSTRSDPNNKEFFLSDAWTPLF